MMALLLTTGVFESIPAAIYRLIPCPMTPLVDGAVRSVLVAGVVWAGIRVLGARNVVTQKAAWTLLLAGAFLMPLVVPWATRVPWVPARATLVVPTDKWLHGVDSASEEPAMAKQKAISRPSPGRDATPATSFSLPPAESIAVDRTTGPVPDFSQSDRFPEPAVLNTYTGKAASETRAPIPARRFSLPLSEIAWLLYCAVCGGLLLRLSYGMGAALGLWQSAEPVRIEPSLLAAGLRVRSSRKVTSPVTVGSGIVLPADFSEWDTEKLRIVLAHERSHVRQGDFYLQALAGIYAALFWFSPLGWWLRRKLSDLSEAISDRAGLEEAASHANYAQILLEFAALPRRTQVGVAMARTGRLTNRIERLLNEHTFRQAFAGGRGRVLAAFVLVPAVLFAAAALIRVEAARTLQQPAASQGPVIAQSKAASAVQPTAVAVAAQAPAVPPAPPSPAVAPAPPSPQEESTVIPQGAPATPQAPEPPAIAPPGSSEDADQDQTVTATDSQCKSNSNSSSDSRHSFVHSSSRHGYSYSYSLNGDSYALVSSDDKKQHLNFSGDWYDGRRAELDKARAMVHGDFLWFTHDGKSYVVDDPQTIASIQAMYKPMEDLGRQQEELGRQQEALGRQQGELGRKQQQASIPTPDIAREMADLNAAVARLQAKKDGTVTQEQLADVEGKIGRLQGKLGGLQGQIGSKQGELGRQQGMLGAEQGKLGAQQGRLGAEQGRIAREADQKVKSIIDESLKNGKARPLK